MDSYRSTGILSDIDNTIPDAALLSLSPGNESISNNHINNSNVSLDHHHHNHQQRPPSTSLSSYPNLATSVMDMGLSPINSQTPPSSMAYSTPMDIQYLGSSSSVTSSSVLLNHRKSSSLSSSSSSENENDEDDGSNPSNNNSNPNGNKGKASKSTRRSKTNNRTNDDSDGIDIIRVDDDDDNDDDDEDDQQDAFTDDTTNVFIPWDCIDVLIRGAPLLKFGRQGEPHFRNFQLSLDCLTLSWASHKKTNADSIVVLKNCVLAEGQQTDVFKRQLRPDLADVSWSLVYDDPQRRGHARTLDIACKDRREYDIWVTALSYLIRHQPPDALLRARQKIIWLDVVSIINGGKRDALTNNRITAALKKKIKDTNDVFGWGKSNWGQLGLGDEMGRMEPILIHPLLGKAIRTIACGNSHCIALSDTGEAYAWGNGSCGRLGTGSVDHELTPRLLTLPSSNNSNKLYSSSNGFVNKGYNSSSSSSAGSNNRKEGISRKEPYRFRTVACGDMHSLAVGTDGLAYAWGTGYTGATGMSRREDVLYPTPVPVFIAINSVSSTNNNNNGNNNGNGISSSAGLPPPSSSSSTTVRSGGGTAAVRSGARGTSQSIATFNELGFLESGNGSVSNNEPGQIYIGAYLVGCNPLIVSVAAGASYSAFVDNRGRLFTCGIMDAPLGHDIVTLSRLLTKTVETNILTAVPGVDEICRILRRDTATMEKKSSSSSSSDDNNNVSSTSSPLRLTNNNNNGMNDSEDEINNNRAYDNTNTKINNRTIPSDQDLLAAENSLYSYAGSGATTAATDLLTPLQVCAGFDPLKEQAISVSCGELHMIIATSTGQAYSWGWGGSGALGHGDTLDRSIPTRIMALPRDVIQVAAGATHTLAIVEQRSTGTRELYAFGSTTYGQVPSVAALTTTTTTVTNNSTRTIMNTVTPTPTSSSTTAPAHTIRTLPRLIELPVPTNSSSLLSSTGTSTLTAFGFGRSNTNNNTSNGSGSITGTNTGTATNNSSVTGTNNGNTNNTNDGGKDENRSPVPRFIAAGSFHSAVITSDGRLYVAGSGLFGELGLTVNSAEEVAKTLVNPSTLQNRNRENNGSSLTNVRGSVLRKAALATSFSLGRTASRVMGITTGNDRNNNNGGGGTGVLPTIEENGRITGNEDTKVKNVPGTVVTPSGEANVTVGPIGRGRNRASFSETMSSSTNDSKIRTMSMSGMNGKPLSNNNTTNTTLNTSPGTDDGPSPGSDNKENINNTSFGSPLRSTIGNNSNFFKNGYTSTTDAVNNVGTNMINDDLRPRSLTIGNLYGNHHRSATSNNDQHTNNEYFSDDLTDYSSEEDNENEVTSSTVMYADLSTSVPNGGLLSSPTSSLNSPVHPSLQRKGSSNRRRSQSRLGSTLTNNTSVNDKTSTMVPPTSVSSNTSSISSVMLSTTTLPSSSLLATLGTFDLDIHRPPSPTRVPEYRNAVYRSNNSNISGTLSDFHSTKTGTSLTSTLSVSNLGGTNSSVSSSGSSNSNGGNGSSSIGSSNSAVSTDGSNSSNNNNNNSNSTGTNGKFLSSSSSNPNPTNDGTLTGSVTSGTIVARLKRVTTIGSSSVSTTNTLVGSSSSSSMVSSSTSNSSSSVPTTVGSVNGIMVLNPPNNNEMLNMNNSFVNETANNNSNYVPLPSTVPYGFLPIPILSKREIRSVACGNGFTIATVATEWMRSTEATFCMRCALPFIAVTRRRHHCRHCGGVFCDNCSSQRIPLLKLGYIEPVRVCDGCYSRTIDEEV